MAGKRINLADLADDEVTPAPVPAILHPTLVPWRDVAPNPVVKRLAHSDLSDLESMKKTQIQACAVVTRGAFHALYPEHELRIGRARYVVVAGTRRRLAAEKWDLQLKIDVNDALASSRAEFLANVGRENIERQAFDPIEEGEYVLQLIAECGGNLGPVAEHLDKSKAWISQRVALTKLVDPLKAEVRAENMPVREARRIGGLPPEDQETAWQAVLDAAATRRNEKTKRKTSTRTGLATETKEDATATSATSSSRPRFSIAPTLSASEIADVLRKHLGGDEVQELAKRLTEAPAD